MLLNEKVAIITGGGTGIGKATALLFAKEGANVALFGRREERLREVEKEIKELYKKDTVIVPGSIVNIGIVN